jgi:hypothetical protein
MGARASFATCASSSAAECPELKISWDVSGRASNATEHLHHKGSAGSNRLYPAVASGLLRNVSESTCEASEHLIAPLFFVMIENFSHGHPKRF